MIIKVKVAIYSISQGSTPTYYVGGKLETGKSNQPIKEESNVEKEKKKKNRQIKYTLKIKEVDKDVVM